MRWDSVRLGSSNLTRTLTRVPAAHFQALKKPYTDHDLLQICPLIRSYLAPQKLRKLLFVKYKDKMVMEEIKQQLGVHPRMPNWETHHMGTGQSLVSPPPATQTAFLRFRAPRDRPK